MPDHTESARRTPDASHEPAGCDECEVVMTPNGGWCHARDCQCCARHGVEGFKQKAHAHDSRDDVGGEVVPIREAVDPPQTPWTQPAEGTSATQTTEHSCALLFTDCFGNTLKYAHGKNRWYRWVGDRWKHDTTRLAFDFARRISASASFEDQGQKATQKSSFASGVERFAQADPTHAVEADYFDNDLDLLGVPGGTVFLYGEEGWSVEEAHPKHRISLQTAVRPDRDTGPDGTDDYDCPRWLQFLDECTDEDPELIEFLRRFMGYSLTGHVHEHTLIYLHGSGANGKTTLLEAWAGLMGEYAQAAAMETFTEAQGERHSTEVAALAGPRLVTVSETEAGRVWAESLLKQLTGGDRMRARFMRQDGFEFSPRLKLAIVGNHLPHLRSTDEAMRRRFRLVPFNRKPEQIDVHLGDKLRAEWPAILTWILDGYTAWATDGLGTAAVVEDATNEYFAASNLVAIWLDEKAQRHDPATGKYETAADLFASWKAWALAAGHEPGNSTTFGRSLAKAGLVKTKSGQIRWLGVALLESGKMTGYAGES